MRAGAIAGLEARISAAHILHDILQHQARLDQAFERRAFERHPHRDRALIRAIVSQTLRRLGEIDALLFQFIANKKPLANSHALMILRISAAQFLYMRIPAYAAIDLAIHAARRNHQARHFTGLINAVLRRLARHTQSGANKTSHPERNVPRWLWLRWARQYGEHIAHKIARAHLDAPPLDLSFSGAAPTIAGVGLLPHSWRIFERQQIERLAGYDQGGWWVQDIAASLAAHVFGDIRAKRLLEFCAAPGGKTAQLAQQGAQVRAVEISAARAERLQENMKRLAIEFELIIADARDYLSQTPYDFILVDAPCSGTGTCRHHPDLIWRRRPEQIARLVEVQQALLRSAYRNLAAGGTLIYAVCSLEAEEGIDIINHFLKNYRDMKRNPIAAGEIGWMDHILTPLGDIRSLPFHAPTMSGKKDTCLKPAEGGMDGFYIARLIRADG